MTTAESRHAHARLGVLRAASEVVAALLLANCAGLADIARPPSAAPRLLAPVDDASVETAFPMLEWGTVPGATAYVVNLAPVNSSAPTRSTTRFTRLVGLSPLVVGQEYEWSVTARNVFGSGPASLPQRFRVSSRPPAGHADP